MRVILDRARYRGRAIGLEDSGISARAAYRAVRRSSAVAAKAPTVPADSTSSTGGTSNSSEQATARRLRVDCAAPGPLHDHVGRIDRTIDLDIRAALAGAARTWGAETSQDQTLRKIREQLAAIDIPAAETDAARRAVARAGADEQRLRESVAELRGRVETLRDVAPDSQRLADAEARLAETVTRLSEVETERVAAEQRLDRAERAARRARDVRERRLRLQDRAANVQREIRSTLAQRARPAFVDAIESLPGESVCSDAGGERGDTGDGLPAGRELGDDSPRESRGDETAAALAIARIADIEAPIVLAADRFATAAAAAAWLDAPVVRVAGLDIQTG